MNWMHNARMNKLLRQNKQKRQQQLAIKMFEKKRDAAAASKPKNANDVASVDDADLGEYSDADTELTGDWPESEPEPVQRPVNDGPGKETEYTYSSICVDENGRMQILSGKSCERQIAVGRFRNAVNLTGWSFLEIETKSGFSSEEQAYAAGVLEGSLSRVVIGYHIHNTVEDACKNYTQYCNRLHSFMSENLNWIREELSGKTSDDAYWAQVNRTFYQLTGLYHGYDNSVLTPTISYALHPILMINSNGEFYDLEKKLNKSRDPLFENGKCSGFVKVAPGNSDLLFSQVTMSGFQFMMRILKVYKFAFDKSVVPGYATTFASYPGMLYSSDDFALMSSGLAALETTISVFNNTLFQYVQPTGQIPMWIRAKVSNELARTGREWCEIFSRYNSGTYNNQWVIVDYKTFTPQKELPYFGLLYVLEQLPGNIIYSDLTWYLRKHSYFPSYNLPFFKKITKISGADKFADKIGNWFRWGKCPRARIFERDHHKVVDLDSLTRLMRYNDFTHDEFSRCNCTPPYSAEAAISARGDLNPADGKYEFGGMGHVNHGALDYKGTNYALFKELRFRAIGCPTYDNVPPFQWSKFDYNTKVKHLGHPDLWKFEAVEPVWETPDVKADL